MATVTVELPTGSYELDPIHSNVGFAVRHMVSTFRGSFSEYEAALVVDEQGNPQVKGSVVVDSIELRDPNLKAHVLSPDFFDVERHPWIDFSSTSVRVGPDSEVVVDGDLTINGITRPVQARGSITYLEADMSGAERIGLDLEAAVDRTQFGLNWNAPLPKGGLALGDEVKLTVELELARK
jgi:polyisoprenoid-binding protein YceI